MAAYQPPPEHLRLAEEALARGLSRSKAWVDLAHQGLTDTQAQAAVDAVLTRVVLSERHRREEYKAAAILAVERLVELTAKAAASADSIRDLKDAVAAGLKAHALLSKWRCDYEDPDEKRLRRALAEARLKALEKAAQSTATVAEITLRWPEDRGDS